MVFTERKESGISFIKKKGKKMCFTFNMLDFMCWRDIFVHHDLFSR